MLWPPPLGYWKLLNGSGWCKTCEHQNESKWRVCFKAHSPRRQNMPCVKNIQKLPWTSVACRNAPSDAWFEPFILQHISSEYIHPSVHLHKQARRVCPQQIVGCLCPVPICFWTFTLHLEIPLGKNTSRRFLKSSSRSNHRSLLLFNQRKKIRNGMGPRPRLGDLTCGANRLSTLSTLRSLDSFDPFDSTRGTDWHCLKPRCSWCFVGAVKDFNSSPGPGENYGDLWGFVRQWSWHLHETWRWLSTSPGRIWEKWAESSRMFTNHHESDY